MGQTRSPRGWGAQHQLCFGATDVNATYDIYDIYDIYDTAGGEGVDYARLERSELLGQTLAS